MCTRDPFLNRLATAVALIAALSNANAEGLGIPASAAEVAARRLNVFPDGKGLPDGKGSALEGKAIYAERCASCHGATGTGGSAEELAGGRLDGPSPDKTIGTYWPYATTVFDFVRRSMPLDAPGSLSSDQLYAVTAYLLNLNGIIDERAEMNAATLPQVKMPNRGGFIAIDAALTPP
ncbi:c-type cytochrome [Methyloterricola oryzae]|uniref:c-type cytochrome n=1 Tax=Methyloterricola oryzae TaxID=1495050 RepID=UPI0005EBDC33|nr:cytochrome c [Methyloterricola oryzae]